MANEVEEDKAKEDKAKEEKTTLTPKETLMVIALIAFIIFMFNSCTNMLGCNRSTKTRWDTLSKEEQQQVIEGHEYWEELHKMGAE